MPTDTEPQAPRGLTGTEWALVQLLLSHDFDGVDGLRLQVPDARVVPGCRCGCGTIDFVSGETEARLPSSLVPVEGTVLSADGEPTGGLLLFVRDGQLVSFEVYSYGHEPLQMPPPERVRWVVR
jgi:hypothetical protein